MYIPLQQFLELQVTHGPLQQEQLSVQGKVQLRQQLLLDQLLEA
jgi:hypothetical protein